MKRIWFLGILVLAATTFFSCQNEMIYSNQEVLPKSGWSKDAPARFDVEISDTLSACDVMFFVRNTTDYPNQNLWLFIDETTPEGIVKCDTLQCFLVDNRGRWVGSGIGSLYYVAVFYKENTVFPNSGIYHYEVRHGMRCDLLEGLREIGIKVQKRKD